MSILSVMFGVVCLVGAIVCLILSSWGLLQKGPVFVSAKLETIRREIEINAGLKREIYRLQALGFFVGSIVFAALAVNSLLDLQPSLFILPAYLIFVVFVVRVYLGIRRRISVALANDEENRMD
ncbi:MAG: hypothetical protein FWG65_09160 [Turicibacter sp.]|nr:hypothetical protein [Turicibacter sp.]